MNYSRRLLSYTFCLLVLTFILVMVICLYSPASASTLTIPTGMKVIEEEAFYGDTSLDVVVLPEGLERIESLAFAHSSVKTINLPDSLDYIAEDAFDKDLSIRMTANEGTKAYIWAVDNGYLYEKAELPAEYFTFDSVDENTCKVTGYQGPSGLEDLVIPSMNSEGKKVVEIGDNAFYRCSCFSGNLIIPNGVTSIGSMAFYNCSGITGDLTIGNGVTSIGNYAFGDCRSLTGNLTIGDSVTSIGKSAFGGCSSLAGNLTIGDSVTSIGDNAFSGCSSLVGNLTIGDSVTSIGDYAFGGCSGLTGSLTIPDSVITIGNDAFYNCSGLTGSLTIPDSVTTIGNAAFYNCSGLTGSLTIPDKVTSIGNSTFSKCSGLTGSLTIPDSVTSIGNYAFNNCSGLTGNLIIPDSVTSIGSRAFYDCSGFTGSLTIGNGVTSIGESAFAGCSSLAGSLIIGDSVTSIGYNAFIGCSGLNGNLIIGNSVTSIESAAFYNCSGLTGSLTIPDSVISIKDYAFYNCSGLTGELTIGNSVTSIGYKAFYNCSGLTGSLVIPDSVISIESFAFQVCRNLTGSLTIGNGVTSIGESAFAYCSSLAGNLTIGDSVISIGKCAFEYCSSLTGSLTIPDSVTSIGDRAFFLCNSFTGRLTIGNGVTSIGSQAFEECSKLTGCLTIPESVSSIGTMAFDNCKSFAGRLIIGNGVTSIGSSVFFNCHGLDKIDVEINNEDGTTSIVSRVAVYCPRDSYAWSWAESDSDSEPVEWDGNYSSLPEESQLSGGFTENEITLTLGDPLVIPKGFVKSYGQDIYRVTLTINDWNQDGTNNNRYATYMCSELQTNTLSLTDWDAFYLDTTREPLNTPGTYTLNLWAAVQEGEGVKLDSMTVNVGWKAYVQGSWVDTYETSISTEVNVHVDNVDPVTVIKEENGRYYIQMIKSDGVPALRWVETTWIGENYKAWIGYVQADSIFTYSDSKIKYYNGHVDNMYPVQVIDVEGKRFKIIMKVSDEGYAERWVDKTYIKPTYKPWTAYVQGESVAVYNGSVEINAAEYISCIQVQVVMDENDRYKIQYENDEGNIIESWIAKSKIGKSQWDQSQCMHSWNQPYEENNRLVHNCSICGTLAFTKGILSYNLNESERVITYYKEYNENGYIVYSRIIESDLDTEKWYYGDNMDESDCYKVITKRINQAGDVISISDEQYVPIIIDGITYNECKYISCWTKEDGYDAQFDQSQYLSNLLGLHIYPDGNDYLIETSYHKKAMLSAESLIQTVDWFNIESYEASSVDEKKQRLRRCTDLLAYAFKTEVNNIYIFEGDVCPEDGTSMGDASAIYNTENDNVYLRFSSQSTLPFLVEMIAHELRHAVQYDIEVTNDLGYYDVDGAIGLKLDSKEGMDFQNMLISNDNDYWDGIEIPEEKQSTKYKIHENQLRIIAEQIVSEWNIPIGCYNLMVERVRNTIRNIKYATQICEMDAYLVQKEIARMYKN